MYILKKLVFIATRTTTIFTGRYMKHCPEGELLTTVIKVAHICPGHQVPEQCLCIHNVLVDNLEKDSDSLVRYRVK